MAPSESHPVSGGRLCARGWNAHEAPLWGARIKHPLLRRDATLGPVSWDEAIDGVTSRLKELIAAGKPVGVLGSARATNEENYLAGRLARAGLHTNNLDSSRGFLCRPLLEGIEGVCGVDACLASLADIASSQAILLLEGNLAESHPRAASQVMKAVERGARLITLAYRMTQMARLSSLVIPTTPGNEREAIRGLLAAVVDLRQQHQTAKAADGEDEEYEALRHGLESVERTDHFRQAAEWIRHAERATFLLACTPAQGAEARSDAAAFATLAAFTGHLGRRGSGLLPLVDRSNLRGVWDMGFAPDRLPGGARIDDEHARNRLQGLWGKNLPFGRGCDTEELLQSVSGLVVLADDPPSVLPNGKRAKAAMEKLEFLAVLDAFVTPTTQIAHVVLPIASFAETDGTVTNMEGRVQRLHRAVTPPGEAKPGWQVLADLCAHFDAGEPYTSANDVLHEIAQAVPRYALTVEQLSDNTWGGVLLESPIVPKVKVRPSASTSLAQSPPNGMSHVLVRDAAYGWSDDPLVSYSPTLSRDSQSERKLSPEGYVELSDRDVDALHASAARRIKLTSVHGSAVVSLRVRKDLKPGVVSVPYPFRDQVAPVLGPDSVAHVKVELP